MQTNKFAKWSLTYGLLSCVLLASVISCTPKMRAGTVTQALQAKADLVLGTNMLDMATIDISEVLSRFRSVPPTQLLIQEPPTFPPIPVTRIQLSTLYGTYKELGAGQFDFIPVAVGGGHFKIEYLNGVTADVTIAKINSRDVVEHFTLTVKSNTRGIATPVSQRVDISVSFKYIDKPDHIKTMDSARIEMLGHLSYVNNVGQSANFDVQRYNEKSTRPASKQSVLVLTMEDKLILYDKRNGPLSPPRWLWVDKKDYVQPAIAGVWAARFMSFTYRDERVSFVSNANYDPAGVTPMGANGSVSYSGQGTVVYQGRFKVATTRGGLHECDLTSLGSPGGGVPLVVEWVDGSSDPFLPSARLTCADAVLSEVDL
jgi:hypothetical protein